MSNCTLLTFAPGGAENTLCVSGKSMTVHKDVQQ